MACSGRLTTVSECFEQEFNTKAGKGIHIIHNVALRWGIDISLTISIVTPTYNGEEAQNVVVGARTINNEMGERYNLSVGNTLTLTIVNFRDLYLETGGTGNDGVVKIEGKVTYNFCDPLIIDGLKCDTSLEYKKINICEEGILGFNEVLTPGNVVPVWQGNNCTHNAGILYVKYSDNTLLTGEGNQVYGIINATFFDHSRPLPIGGIIAENVAYGDTFLAIYIDLSGFSATADSLATTGSITASIDMTLYYY